MCYIFSGPVTCDSSKAAAVAAVSHIIGAVIDTNKLTGKFSFTWMPRKWCRI